MKQFIARYPITTGALIGSLLGFLLFLATSCAPAPELAPVPQPEIKLVVDATAIQVETVIAVNNFVVGRISAYGSKTLSFPESYLRNGRCAYVSARVTGGGGLRSTEECLRRDDKYFTMQVQPNVIWLNPRR